MACGTPLTGGHNLQNRHRRRIHASESFPSPADATGGLRVVRRSSLAKIRSSSSPGTPVRRAPASSQPRAAAEQRTPARSAAGHAPKRPSRPIQNPRPGLDQTYPFVQNPPIAIQRPRCEDTASAGSFAKEPPSLLEINPPSNSVEKYLQICPSFYVLDPELFRFRTRSPPVAVLRVRPWS